MSVLLLPFWGLLETDILTIGRATVTIDGIVVVQSTCRVDITDIVSVPRVRSTHPPIRRRLADK